MRYKTQAYCMVLSKRPSLLAPPPSPSPAPWKLGWQVLQTCTPILIYSYPDSSHGPRGSGLCFAVGAHTGWEQGHGQVSAGSDLRPHTATGAAFPSWGRDCLS